MDKSLNGRGDTSLKMAEGASAEVTASSDAKGALDKIWTPAVKVVTYLTIWYVGNIYYNIYNKKACIALGKNAAGGSNLHWLLSAVQLLVGVLFVIPQWYVCNADSAYMRNIDMFANKLHNSTFYIRT
jgi:hypothetical protein